MVVEDWFEVNNCKGCDDASGELKLKVSCKVRPAGLSKIQKSLKNDRVFSGKLPDDLSKMLLRRSTKIHGEKEKQKRLGLLKRLRRAAFAPVRRTKRVTVRFLRGIFLPKPKPPRFDEWGRIIPRKPTLCERFASFLGRMDAAFWKLYRDLQAARRFWWPKLRHRWWTALRVHHHLLMLASPHSKTFRSVDEQGKESVGAHPDAITRPQALQLLWTILAIELLAAASMVRITPKLREYFSVEMIPADSPMYGLDDIVAGLRLFALGAIPALIALPVRIVATEFFRGARRWGGEGDEGPPGWAIRMYWKMEDMAKIFSARTEPWRKQFRQKLRVFEPLRKPLAKVCLCLAIVCCGRDIPDRDAEGASSVDDESAVGAGEKSEEGEGESGADDYDDDDDDDSDSSEGAGTGRDEPHDTNPSPSPGQSQQASAGESHEKGYQLPVKSAATPSSVRFGGTPGAVSNEAGGLARCEATSAASPPTALATTSYGSAVDGVQEGTDLPKANRFLARLALAQDKESGTTSSELTSASVPPPRANRFLPRLGAPENAPCRLAHLALSTHKSESADSAMNQAAAAPAAVPPSPPTSPPDSNSLSSGAREANPEESATERPRRNLVRPSSDVSSRRLRPQPSAVAQPSPTGNATASASAAEAATPLAKILHQAVLKRQDVQAIEKGASLKRQDVRSIVTAACPQAATAAVSTPAAPASASKRISFSEYKAAGGKRNEDGTFAAPPAAAPDEEAPTPVRDPLSFRLDILDRAVPWSALKPPEESEPEDDIFDDSGYEPPDTKTPYMLRWRERYPEATEEELFAQAEDRVRKMKLMQKAYCPTRYHVIAWLINFLIVASAAIAAGQLADQVPNPDQFHATQPLLIWLASYVWFVGPVEGVYSLGWALRATIKHMWHHYDVWLRLNFFCLARREAARDCVESLKLRLGCGSAVLDDEESLDDASLRT